ncbi:MAG: peptide chain release factor N(5)-glutamine methyltransferase [Candidatus Riflebacteria bacterium]|nr:peptide chain release factor N(5)-glutamine methyltransferase [Candidatus Riflebacteria bacterium]
MTVREALQKIERLLTDGGVPEPHENAEFLVASVLDCKRGQLPLLKSLNLPDTAAEKLELLVRRRLAREPLQYLLGEWPFLDITLYVAPGALIPRPETEEWVDRLSVMFLARTGDKPFKFADIGTGTGAIGLELSARFKNASGLLIDRSSEALDIASVNLARHPDLARRLQLLQANLLDAVRINSFDLLVSNPPYIDQNDIPTLQPEVRLFEPTLALDGGCEGLELCQRLLYTAGSRLRQHGLFAMEHGHGQRAALLRAPSPGLNFLQAYDDLEGRERALIWEKM